MTAPSSAVVRWMDAEASALAERLASVPRFAATIPMVRDAIPQSDALERADAVVGSSRRVLAHHVRQFRRALRVRPGDALALRAHHRRYVGLRGRFNALLGTVDVFADALTQRSEHGIGVVLRGLDAFARDALRTEPPLFTPPPIVCYLDRGFGGAIRRALTRLPGGERNDVALIKLPRERLFGVGLASVIHEAGHQGVASLHLVAAYRAVVERAVSNRQVPPDIGAWWISKMSEVLPDLWACAKLGAAGTLGLMSVLGGSSRTVFYDNAMDPHPMPWIRVQMSAAFGRRVMPHAVWDRLGGMWLAMYPLESASPEIAGIAARIRDSVPVVADLIADARPRALQGGTLATVLGASRVAPGRVLGASGAGLWTLRFAPNDAASPCATVGRIGLARFVGELSAAEEHRLLGRYIRSWARASASRSGERCAA